MSSVDVACAVCGRRYSPATDERLAALVEHQAHAHGLPRNPERYEASPARDLRLAVRAARQMASPMTYVGWDGREYEDPERRETPRDGLVWCGAPTRRWGGAFPGPCLLEPSHRGHHSVSVFTCDQCGHRRRNPPRYSEEDLVLCFFCYRQNAGGAW